MEVNATPDAPVDLQTLTIPDEYKSYEPVSGQVEDFLVVVTGAGPNRMLLFGRQGKVWRRAGSLPGRHVQTSIVTSRWFVISLIVL